MHSNAARTCCLPAGGYCPSLPNTWQQLAAPLEGFPSTTLLLNLLHPDARKPQACRGSRCRSIKERGPRLQRWPGTQQKEGRSLPSQPLALHMVLSVPRFAHLYIGGVASDLYKVLWDPLTRHKVKLRCSNYCCGASPPSCLPLLWFLGLSILRTRFYPQVRANPKGGLNVSEPPQRDLESETRKQCQGV